MAIHKSVSELIGKTPLVELTNYEKNHNLEATIVGKVELFNPAGSVKDRIAKAMLDKAEAAGKLNSETVIIEPTSGNTGIGLSAIAAARGNRIIITMPETMSIERRNLMKAYGAELVLTDGSKGMKGAIARAQELSEEIPNSFIPSQFTNPANPAVHEATTGPEIWADTEGKIDIKAYGAELVLTDGSKGMKGAIARAQELSEEIPNSFIPSQFTNPANPAVHEATTGPEIWEDTEGKIDIFVAGVGTGGTLSGTGAFLKSKNPDIKVVAVEPAGSPVLSEGHGGAHKIQGIGAGFVPDTLNTEIYDEVLPITDEEAFEAGRELAGKDGLLVGISSGAAVAAATKLAQRPENKGKVIVAVLPDTGERYLSTAMFNF